MLHEIHRMICDYLFISIMQPQKYFGDEVMQLDRIFDLQTIL